MTENDNVRERLARAVNAALDTWEYDNADGVTQSEHVSDAILNEFPELGREPEWEVQYGRMNRETGEVHWLRGAPFDDWWHENQDRYEHVKRYTSKPRPVGGVR